MSDQNQITLTVFHGTTANFDKFDFDLANSTANTGVPRAVCFSTNAFTAATYAGIVNKYVNILSVEEEKKYCALIKKIQNVQKKQYALYGGRKTERKTALLAELNKQEKALEIEIEPLAKKRHVFSGYEFETGANVRRISVTLQNPMICDAKGEFWKKIRFDDMTVTANELASIAKALGHDSLVIKNVIDFGWHNPDEDKTIGDTVFVFDERILNND